MLKKNKERETQATPKSRLDIQAPVAPKQKLDLVFRDDFLPTKAEVRKVDKEVRKNQKRQSLLDWLKNCGC